MTSTELLERWNSLSQRERDAEIAITLFGWLWVKDPASGLRCLCQKGSELYKSSLPCDESVPLAPDQSKYDYAEWSDWLEAYTTDLNLASEVRAKCVEMWGEFAFVNALDWVRDDDRSPHMANWISSDYDFELNEVYPLLAATADQICLAAYLVQKIKEGECPAT